ncbi:MAG TPA: general secretion pathway protein GspB [Steroidobacteraceae bacterium]|nr:general secretion pathway protein GspB [Steroidobacteraceae bacterium]
MSFILDALKKSELERQRQSTPGLVEAGIVRPRARLPLWAIALMLLLGVNLLVLAALASRGMLFGPHPVAAAGSRSGSERATLRNDEPARSGDARRGMASSGTADSSTADSSTADSSGASGAPSAQAPGDSSIASSAQPAAHRVEAPASNFSPMEGSGEFAPEIPVSQASVAPAPPAPRITHHRESKPLVHEDEPPDEILPSIGEIRMTGPELHLDVHVYATQPADRFVYINNRKYREGQTLEEGPTIERIRRDGVVLAYEGVRFLLPRQH